MILILATISCGGKRLRAFEERVMQGKDCNRFIRNVCAFAVSLCLCAAAGSAQEIAKLAPSSSPAAEASPDVRALSELIRDLQTQVQALNSQLSDVRGEQQRASDEARDLRRELDVVRARVVPLEQERARPELAANAPSSPAQPARTPSYGAPQETSPSDRLAQLGENQEVQEGKINDLYQTKVESGSKYRLRLSGIVLLNMYDNRGSVNNQDFPQYADRPDRFSISPSSFGGSLRQSQIN